MDLTHELETAKTIARMAASICQNIQDELIVTEKSGHEPVTIADYASQALILSALANNFEDDAVLAEEHSEEYELLLSDPQRQLVARYVEDALGGYVFAEDISAYLDFGRKHEAERLWVVDPIDGTKGFVAVEIYYCHTQALNLPVFTLFVPNPLMIHAYTIMPLPAAAPTPTPR